MMLFKRVLFILALISAASLFGEAAFAEANCADSEPKVEGRRLHDLTQEKMFNGHLHSVVLKTRALTHETVLERGKKKAFDLYARAFEFCFYQNSTDAAPERCVNDVGYRVRGNQSRRREKRQFKVKINASKNLFEGDVEPWEPDSKKCAKQKRFYGLESVTLRSAGASSNDPTFIREPMAAEIFGLLMKQDGQPVPVYRVSYTRLYVQACEGEGRARRCEDPVYKGLYFLTDEIDDQMVEGFLGYEPDGALFELGYGTNGKRGDFSYENFSADAYDSKSFALSKPVLKAVQSDLLVNWNSCSADFAKDPAIYLPSASASSSGSGGVDVTSEEFIPYLFMCATVLKIEAATQLGDAAMVRELEKIFDLDGLLSYIIGVNFTGHWDSLLSNSNNEFLYFNPHVNGGRWQLFVWDLDLTFGAMDGYQRDVGVLEFRTMFPSRLLNLLTQSPILRERYLKLYQAKLTVLTDAELDRRLTYFENFVKSAVAGTTEDDADFQNAMRPDPVRDFLVHRRKAVVESLKQLLP